MHCIHSYHLIELPRGLYVQQDQELITYRRRRGRRRRRSAGVWVTFAVATVLLASAGAAAYAWSRTRGSQPSSAAAATPAAPETPSAKTPQDVALEPSALATAATPSKVTSSAPKATTSDAVANAAVKFPDAPSVTPQSINRLKPKHKYVAITLDDGYGYQPEMLALLQKYDARCTTFLLGEWMVNNKSTVRKLDEAGFEIANHTWDHKILTKLSDAQVRSELLRTQKVITGVTGNQVPYMRPPGGGTNPTVKAISGDLGYQVIMWNRTFADSSKHASPDNSYHWVMEYGGGVKPGDIILCHWGSKNTFAAMQRILPELKAQGFEFVTISELIADSEPIKTQKKTTKGTTPSY